jgi:predicted acylesterase/phospholipase RssA
LKLDEGRMKATRDALVLSAGGLFAAYQAGVYKALWQHWKPDLVVGASAGALNAWLIAAGIHPDELIRQWLHPDSAGTLKFRDAGRLLARARALQRDFPRKLPLAVVSVEVPRFRPRLFRDDEITPEHLVATCSIPLFYPTVRINGTRLLDGGLFNPTPVWAAAAMGASRAIAVNALPKLTPWPLNVVISSMQRMRGIPVPASLDVRMIKPSGTMGSARDAVVWERGNLQRWVDMGIRDGEQFLTAL